MARLRRILSLALRAGVVAVGLFVALELGARVLGIGEPGAGEVYASDATYIRPHPERARTFVTNYWGSVRDELEFTLPEDATNVLLLGGSNAFSFGADPLLRGLAEACPGRTFHVENLGRNAFGSERTRHILDQALALTRPDAIVLYLGDNEFVESRLPHALYRAPRALKELRTVRAAVALWEDLRRGDDPEPWTPARRDYDYDELTPAASRAVLDELRANVDAMVRAAEARGVRVVLCTVAYNRFASPQGNHPGADLAGEELERFRGAWSTARQLLPRFLDPLLPIDDTRRVSRRDWGVEGVGGSAADPRRGVRPLRGALAELDLELPPPEGWSARVQELDACLARFLARDLKPGQRERLVRAAEELDRALALSPDHPDCLFERGLVAHLLEEDPREVARLLVAAARADRVPKKSNEAINELLREVAAEHPGVLLFDADRLLAEGSPDGLVGFELMFDACHLLPGVRAHLMRRLGRAICATWYGGDASDL